MNIKKVWQSKMPFFAVPNFTKIVYFNSILNFNVICFNAAKKGIIVFHIPICYLNSVRLCTFFLN